MRLYIVLDDVTDPMSGEIYAEGEEIVTDETRKGLIDNVLAQDNLYRTWESGESLIIWKGGK